MIISEKIGAKSIVAVDQENNKLTFKTK